MDEKSLTLGLFEPGMTPLHRAGVAGLHMTLQGLKERGRWFDGATWAPELTRVRLRVEGGWKPFMEWLFAEAFKIDEQGLIRFGAHEGQPMGDLERIHLTGALYRTFLQHPQQNRIPAGTKNREVSLSLDGKGVVATYKPFSRPYAHATAAGEFHTTSAKGKPKVFQPILAVDRRGRLKGPCQIKGWLYPGAAERHSGLPGTEFEETPERLIALLFAPVACLYYQVTQRMGDGRLQWSTAIVAPDVTDIPSFSRSYHHYLQCRVRSLYAAGVGDAGLSALVALKGERDVSALGVRGVHVLTMGNAQWNPKQQVKIAVLRINSLSEPALDLFSLAWGAFKNQVHVKDDGRFIVFPSVCRGLVADNVAVGKDWFHGFSRLMGSGKLARTTRSERKGLRMMTEQVDWPMERDALFVQAVHTAIRNRYGAMASRSQAKGEVPQFEREFEKIRTSLMRAKNAQTLRAELADLFARGGINKALQSHWKEILPIYTGTDWQRARDLALLGLASYSGAGAKQVEAQIDDVKEEEGEL